LDKGDIYRHVMVEEMREGDSDLNPYGLTNEAEFFAVATESFFEKPEQLHKRTPDLYAVLKRFYGCDPLENRRDKGAA